MLTKSDKNIPPPAWQTSGGEQIELDGQALPAVQQRWLSIDALRGVAVLLMIAQHVTYWICYPAKSGHVLLFTGAMGGLAAPIFVTLAGLGATFLAQRRDDCDRTMVIRGVMVICYGYLMNFLTPHWFDPASWYVLHMIGFALMTAPLLRRMPTRALMWLFFVVLVTTIVLQTWLDTPYRLFNNNMDSPTKPGGLLRFIAAEGFFPVFPWLAFFIAGMITGRWLLEGRLSNVWRAGVFLFAIMAVLLAFYYSGISFTRSKSLIRFFMLRTTFYPAMTPITLFLIGISLLFVYLSIQLDKKITFRSSNFLVCLGRASLTFLILHVAVIREGAFHFRYWHTLSGVPGALTVLAILAFFSVAAVLWRKVNYRFGFEWLLRLAAG